MFENEKRKEIDTLPQWFMNNWTTKPPDMDFVMTNFRTWIPLLNHLRAIETSWIRSLQVVTDWDDENVRSACATLCELVVASHIRSIKALEPTKINTYDNVLSNKKSR